MDSLADKVVTLASLRRPRAESEAIEAQQGPTSPEERLVLDRYRQLMERLQDATDDVGADVLITAQDRAVSRAQSRIAEVSEAKKSLDSGGTEVQFGTGLSGGDWIRWAASVLDWAWLDEAHPIVRPTAAEAQTLTGDITVAMVADWGTGLYGAPKIADSIRAMATDDRFDLVLHLGDVYYSGTEGEVKERFLNLWPSDAGNLNRALNGNHEMYSGGFGYFDLILPAFGQSCSYFALQNEHWLLVGLDTAYVDHEVDAEQLKWLDTILTQAELPSRKVVLFSHQQPFSRLDGPSRKLAMLRTSLRRLLDERVITAWYWGHEHQCVIYDRHREWGFLGRCLGNGGIPEPRRQAARNAPLDATHAGVAGCVWRRLTPTADSPGCIVLDGQNMDMKKTSHQQKFVPHGFMTLDFQGPSLVERVFQSNGTELFANRIG